MWINTLNPVLLDLGFAQIRWYGLVYVLGFFLGVWGLYYLKKKGKFSLSTDQIWDLMFYLMLGVLIGSRVFMIFWEPQTYLYHPLELLKIWNGGMSFHGGFAGIIVAAVIYCRRKKTNFWEIADAMSFPTMFALALGRIANFVNGELVGTVWNGPWCVIFPGYDDLCRHPQTLYAAGYRFILSGWLALLTLKEKFPPGFVFMNFMLLEGICRFIVDFFREDVLYFGLSLGQWFSVVMIIVAVTWMWKNRNNIYKTKEFLTSNGTQTTVGPK
jgi:phosphatidylglycerol:prolipoprotein diacylglycerol transferase